MKVREKILWILCTLQAVALYLILSYERCGLTIFGTINNINFAHSGSWGQMVSAIGTTMAFFIAFANLISTRLIYNAGEERRKKEEETAVSIWLSYSEEVDNNGNHVGWQWDINVQNSTKAQIYNWLIKIESYEMEDHLCNFVKKPLIPEANTFNLPFLDNNEPSQSPKAEIIFESKTNAFWSKTTNGVLKQVTSTELKCSHRHD